jgi:integrase
MAVVVRDSRNRSPFWYACFSTADGRRLKKSTKETNREKAKIIAEALQNAENMAAERTLTARRTRDLLSDVLQRVTGEKLHVFTVETWLDLFVKQKQKSRADKTALRHEQMMKEFVEFLDHRARLNIAAISSKDIEGFRDHRQSRGLAPSTLNTDMTVLSAAFNAALRQGHISVNPCLAIEPLKDKTQRKGVFTPEQVAALLKAADGEWPGLILMAFYTGARLGDCANLQWKHIDFVSEIKTIRFDQGKTGAEIITVIHPVLEDFLLSQPAPKTDEAFLFPSLAQRNISPLSKHFRKILERAHIEQCVIREKSESSVSGRNVFALSFHSLRHSFTSILANAGVSEELRMALTGHKERAVHQRYTHRELQRLADAIGKLPRVGVN